MRSSAILLASVALVGLSACGTIIDGGSQTVDVVVKGSPSAQCDFYTSVYRNSAIFPNKMTVERSRENLQADCRGEQNRHIKFEVPSVMTASGTLGNVATGVIPGMSYDAMSGGLWTYPDPIIVDFRKNYAEPTKQVDWPTDTVDGDLDPTRVGTANIAAPSPIRMQPIQDDELNPALPTTHAPLAKTEVIDAVRLATDKKATAPVMKVETTTTTPAPVAAKAQMKPVISPEDDPAVMKAKEEAKKKAAAEAKRKADEKKKADEEAAAKKAAAEAEEAKAAADKAAQEAAEAAKAAQDAAATTLPEAPASTAPTEPAAPAPAPAAAPTAPAPEPAPAPAATTPAPAPATPSAMPSTLMDTPQKKETTTPPAAPADGQSVDKKQYLEGQ